MRARDKGVDRAERESRSHVDQHRIVVRLNLGAEQNLGKIIPHIVLDDAQHPALHEALFEVRKYIDGRENARARQGGAQVPRNLLYPLAVKLPTYEMLGQ